MLKSYFLRLELMFFLFSFFLLIVHVLSPNIYRSVSEAVQAFNYFSEVSDWGKNLFNVINFFIINDSNRGLVTD